ncbi:MFS transporter [Devosia lacusdianchii]|uniref:MFS transporter n=1 Tax=Devosia lacusdianchii TaxID=2917991 RepID=UPI001F063B3A|nr:MFS transporter [Devosia sp. JXJ CY 41]
MQIETPRRLPSGFVRLGWSTLSAQSAEQIGLAAAPLAAVLLLNAGPAETGLLQAAQTLPFLLFAIPAGLIVDRASRKGLMAGAELLRAAALACILLLVFSSTLSLPLLAALGFVGALGTVCFTVAAPALVPALVPRPQLTRANRWLELARSAAFVAGAPIGGAIVGWAGVPLAYALATALALMAAGLLVGIAEPSRELPPPRHPLHDLREGLQFVSRHALLRPIVMTAIVFNVSWFVLQAVFVAYAVRDLGVGATGVGLILGTYGLGMFVGASAVPLIERYMPLGAMIVIGPFCGLLGASLLLLTLWIPSGFLAAAGYFLFGCGPMIWTITTISLRQSVTPQTMLGRVSALVTTGTTGAAPVGALLGAFLAAHWGVAACLAVAVVGFAGQFAIIAASRVPQLEALPEPA